ncbi:MAG: DUF3656 domain-containing protein [Planctomycetes bacterium]|nr:DUF3656 domain-containing protein [Planctomycetota bacterium]
MVQPSSGAPEHFVSSPPRVGPDPGAAAWHGLTPLHVPLHVPSGVDAAESPEPAEPQGDYAAAAEAPLAVPSVADPATPRVAELLSPAGGPDSAFAAFQFGADAVYLGLKKFSARAEAQNFELPEVEDVVGYAHSLTPARRVFVTVNTVIRQDELAELAEVVSELSTIGVDALIVQDLGVYRLVREHFPDLELHASTQLAVHDRAGAEVLRQLGFARVVLARELTFEEVRDVTAHAGIETEVFVHGALCYSYSGLCLFSSQTLGRSGNRGRCAYSCRDSFEVSGAPDTLRDGSPVRRDPRHGLPFSMKDLALPDHLPALRAAGVSCFKIEGRKKSALYAATTTDYYRRLLDGRLSPAERPELEADLQTVFSRPWTRLFMQSHRDKEVADRDTTGHRGALCGAVETTAGGRLRFRTARALERHDGLQIDVPGMPRPFGFPIDRLWIVDERAATTRRTAFEAPAGALIEVELPAEHPPLPIGAPVYCASSQTVKRRYRARRPKPGAHRRRLPIDVRLSVRERELVAIAEGGGAAVRRVVAGPFELARNRSGTAAAMADAFARLGDTGLALRSCAVDDPDGRFVPKPVLHALRRAVAGDLERALEAGARDRAARVSQCVLPPSSPPRTVDAFAWSVKVDRLAFLGEFEAADFDGVEEITVEIARDHPALLLERLDELAARIGRDRVRLALPVLTRAWEQRGIRQRIERLRAAGWRRFEAANLSAWSYLGLDPLRPDAELDLATDWPLYVVNRLAALQLVDMGVSRFALSPEDGLDNMRSLLAEFADRATVIVHQDTPQFIAESCAYANLIGGCPGKANCRFESMEMESERGERVTAIDHHCRTIVLDRETYCLAHLLPELARAGAVHLRADFVLRSYSPAQVRDRWRAIRAGRALPATHCANFARGLS